MKWSIIRVGIVAMFMSMATIVLGMTDDDPGATPGRNGISVSCSNINPGGTV